MARAQKRPSVRCAAQGEAGIEIERCPELTQRPVMVSCRAEAQPGDHPGPRVARIEGQRILGMRRRLGVAFAGVRVPIAERGPPDCPAQERMGPGIVLLHRDGATEKSLSFQVLLALHLVDHAQGADDEPPGIDAVRLFARGPKTLLGVEEGLHRGHDPFGDVILNGEDVLQLAVVLLGPDMLAGFGVDQLAGDADAAARRSDAALQDIANSEVPGDLPDIDGFALVNEARIPGDDEEPTQARQRRDDVLGHAVSEVILLGIATQIGEGQDRYGRLLDLPRLLWACIRADRPESRRKVQGDAISAYWPIDVLEHLLAHVLESEIESVADVISDGCRDRDPTRFRYAFQPRRQIDAVTVDVFGLDDHVPEVDAHAKLYPAVLRHTRIALSHPPLDRGRAGHSIHDAWKPRQKPVARVLHDAPLILGDFGVDQFPSVRFPCGMSARLVQAHEPSIGHNICGEDGGQTPVHRRIVHVTPARPATLAGARIPAQYDHTPAVRECLYLLKPCLSGASAWSQLPSRLSVVSGSPNRPVSQRPRYRGSTGTTMSPSSVITSCKGASGHRGPDP